MARLMAMPDDNDGSSDGSAVRKRQHLLQQRLLGERLRQLFHSYVEAPIPGRLTALLQRLEGTAATTSPNPEMPAEPPAAEPPSPGEPPRVV